MIVHVKSSVNVNHYLFYKFLQKYVNLILSKKNNENEDFTHFTKWKKWIKTNQLTCWKRVRRTWVYGGRKVLWYQFRPHDHLQIGICSSYGLFYLTVLYNWNVLVVANITFLFQAGVWLNWNHVATIYYLMTLYAFPKYGTEIAMQQFITSRHLCFP